MLARWVLLAALLLAATACGSGGGPGAEALEQKAATLTDLVAQNDWTAVREDFDATMQAQLDEEGLEAAWRQVTGLRGSYESRGEPARVHKPGDFLVFDTPMTFERGAMKSRVTFHPDGQVAGLFILFPDVA